MTAEAPAIDAALGEESGGRVLVALCVASFLASTNFFAPTPFYPEMARDLDTSVPLLGQATTSMILVSAGLGLLVGPLADRYGYRWPLVGGVLAVAVNLVGTGLAPSYPVLLGMSLIGGLADAMVFGLPLALAGICFSGDALRRALGWIIGCLSSGSIVGVPALTAVAGTTSWRAALVMAGVGAAGSAWFMAAALPRDGARPSGRFRAGDLWSAYAPLLRQAPVLRLYGATALRAVTWFGLLTYLGAFLADELGLSTPRVGLVYTVSGLGYAAGSVLGGRMRLGRVRALVGAVCVLGGVTVGLVLLIPDVWVAVPLLLGTSFASAVAGIALASLLATESRAGSGTTMVLNGSVLNIGAAGGAALGGGLLAAGGYPALGFGLPVFALLAAGLAWWPSGGDGG